MKRWYKGNLHTHTSGLGSDGSASPENVVLWYKKHNYDFISITDHNILTEFQTEDLVLVKGEEVGKQMKSGNGPVHINGFGITRTVNFLDATNVVPTIQANIDGIRQAGGIASLNHPNDRWGFNHEDIIQTSGATLMEIFNGGGANKNNDGAPGKPSCEQIWDAVLSTTNKQLYGIATDDAHHYDEFRADRANPGRGWVVIRTDVLNENSVINALSTGSFYSSNGVTLEEVEQNNSISIQIKPSQNESYTTVFTGAHGTSLAQITGMEPTYQIQGDETYVRATITSSDGKKAWTQPIFINQ